MFEELKQRISEDIVEGAEQQAANLLGSVEKEKVGSNLDCLFFLTFIAFLLGLGMGMMDHITASATSGPDYQQPPEARRRARQGEARVSNARLGKGE